VERTDVLARGPLELTVPDARIGTARVVALVAVVALVSGLAAWLVSPRFELQTPSLVDDWAAIARAPDELHDVLLLENPEEQRFRPGWIAWNAVQWHTLDAPRGMVGPNFWNVLRIVVLVGGLTLLTSLMLSRPRRLGEVVLHAALAGVPAFLVVTVPKFAVDLSRFGPQEPLLVGGMTLGGSLLVLSARLLLDAAHPVPRLRAAVLALAGVGFWAVGVYEKETSLAVVPLLAAALFVGRERLSAWGTLSRRRRVAVGALGAGVALPLLHVVVESLRIVGRGDLVYGAEVDAGQGIVRGLGDLYDWASEALPPAGRAIVVGAVVATGLATVVRRKVDVLAYGALLSGALALVLVAQSGVVATRYYIPAYALFAVGLAASIARLPLPVQVAGILAIVLAFTPPTTARDEVRAWVDDEAQQAELVERVAELDSAGCTVAAAGLDAETRRALPVVVAVARPGSAATCEGSATYLVLGGGERALLLARACAPAYRKHVVQGGEAMALFRCGRLRSDPVRDPVLGPVAPEVVVALYRLRPSLDD
jgi:hypothetical protein